MARDPRVGHGVGVPPLYTIGYEGRSLDELLAVLQAEAIERVLDVRELPLSRRRGFSKTPLGSALAAAGIEYVHLRLAGNPHRVDKAALSTAELLARYRAHLDASRAVVPAVADAVGRRRVALLCYERDPAACHRTLLAERVARRLRVKVRAL